MSLLVKDSMSGKMVEVGESGGLSLYICGPTVYDHIHVGNARAPLFWDVVARYLRSRGYDVTFVQNITDIEDKIINKANQEGVSWQEIVDRYTDSFHERLEMLGIGLPDIEPRATEHIPEMISLIEELIEKGHAYAPEEAKGDVYYAVGRFPRHENELAQSAAAHPDLPFVRAWAHHGMVTLGGSNKMAKSVGNVLDVERAVNLHGRNAVRMWLLQSHYSQPIEYSEEILDEKRRSYERLMRLYLQ